MTGALWAVVAGVGFGLFQTLNRRAVQGMDVFVATFLQLVISAVVLAGISLATQDMSRLWQAPLSAWLNFSIAGLLHFFIGWTFLNASQKRIGAARTGWATWNAVMHEGIILLAAQAMGGVERALEITVDYAKTRHQFDKPLGAFQAIAHYLADAATVVDGGRTLVHEAAWALAAGRPIDKLAPMAKLFACQTFRDTTAMCEQVWGGVGFTIEYDIQLYFRRAKQLQMSWWDTRALEERVAAAVLD